VHDEELHDLYFSVNWGYKIDGNKMVEHMTSIGEKQMHIGHWWENLKKQTLEQVR
jgi:hypothetical protein